MIWIDLDETLVHSWSPLVVSELMAMECGVPVSQPPKRGERRYRYLKASDGEITIARVRPCATLLLAQLRSLGQVRLLTRATRGYSLQMVSAFNLGFSPAEVIASEDMVQHIESGIVPVDPEGVLVENDDYYRDGNLGVRVKIAYLGCDSEHIVRVPVFDDMTRRDPLTHNLAETVSEIRRLYIPKK